MANEQFLTRFRSGQVFYLMIGFLLYSVTMADQLTPNPNPIGETIFIDAVDSYWNSESYHNEGTIDNSGAIDNYLDALIWNRIYGIIYNRDSGTIENNGRILNDSEFENYGTIDNMHTGYIVSWGIFNNYLDILNRGTILNGAILNNELLGTIENLRTFTNGLSSTINNSGTIVTRTSSYSWNAYIINNSGTINLGPLANFWNDPFATINNSGTIVNKSNFDNDGTINNDGTIKTTHSLHNLGTIDNSPTGIIHNVGSIDNYYHAPYRQGTINNYGIIDNVGFIGNYFDVTINNYGIIDNVDIILNAGYIENSGTINNEGIFGNFFCGTFDNTYGTFDNNGTLMGTGTFIGNLLNDSGIVAPGNHNPTSPGNSVGTMTIDGDFTLDGLGILDIEIGGFDGGQYDLLDIKGTADLLTGGTIHLKFLDGYDITSDVGHGESLKLQFLQAGTINGFESTIVYDFLDSPPGFNYEVFQQENRLIFRATNTNKELPVITHISATPNVLWPANHKMVEVIVEVDAEDNSGEPPVCLVVDVTCNEPINDPEDGGTEPDWNIIEDNPLAVLLRAERMGSGDGRIYTIHVACIGSSGTTIATVDVTVLHDQERKG